MRRARRVWRVLAESWNWFAHVFLWKSSVNWAIMGACLLAVLWSLLTGNVFSAILFLMCAVMAFARAMD